MATRKRPRAARDTVGQESARLRRGAPGKRFIGDRAGQSRAAKRQELERGVRMAEDHRREELRQVSVTGILVELFVNAPATAETYTLAPHHALPILRRGLKAEA